MTNHQSNSSKSLQKAVIGVYFLCLFVMAAFACKRPYYNWDMLAYMALAVQMDHKGITEIHHITYASAKENTPPVEYGYLVSGDQRKAKAENPTVFYNVLPFYAVKPMYTRMVYLFYKMGFSLPIATVIPSLLFYLLIGGLIFYWLSRDINIFYTSVVSVLIMYSGILINLARLSTPDCISAFFLLTAFYFILEKPSARWMFLFLVLSMFARLDNSLPAFMIISFLFFSNKWGAKILRRDYLLMLLILVACYFGITYFSLWPFGWNLFFYPSFFHYIGASNESYTSVSVRSYLSFLYSRAIFGILQYHFMLFMIFLSLILYPLSRAIKASSRKLIFDQLFSILLLAIIIIRFLLFPDLDDRFNAAYYLAFLLIFIKRYTTFFSSSPSKG